MSFLEEKNKKLYRQKNVSPDDLEKAKDREDFYVEERGREKESILLDEGISQSKKIFASVGTKKILLWGQGFLFLSLFILGGIFLFIRYQETAFSEDRVKIATICPEEINSGEKIVCKMEIENANKLGLEEVVLRVNYSDELEFVKSDLGTFNPGLKFGQVEVGNLAKGEKKVFQLEFDVFGLGGAQIFLEGTLRYKLNNFGVTMEKKGQFSGFVKSSPLALFLVSAGESAEGELVEVQAIVKNESQEAFSDLFLQVQLPDGFILSEDSLTETEKTAGLWPVGNLSSGEQKTISFRGTLVGTVSSLKEVKVSLGKNREGEFSKYAEASKMIKLVGSRIQLEHFINNSKDLSAVDDGQTLEFKVVFKNNSDRPLRDLILTEKLEGMFVNEERLNLLGKGFYDSVNKQIIWKASEVDRLGVLDPGQSGQVSFLVYLKENLPIVDVAQANQQIFYQSEIESLDINSPLGENKKVLSGKKYLKINSNVSLELGGSRESEGFSSFGPWPLESGIETSVVLKLRLKNSFNDLKNVSVRMAFPSRVIWKNNFKNSFGKVTFNSRSNELVWERGELKAGTGYYLAEDYLHFQIGVIPSENDVTKELLKIVNTWSLSAEDVFTGQKIQKDFSDFVFGRLEGL